MNKKFGVSYNVFDGEENLRDSILSIRDSIDYISVVYQEISNHGNKCSDNLLNTLNDLVKENYIDEIYEYKPKLDLSPHFNEINKRNIGYFISLENNMDYHMSMDCDEIYLKDEFEYIKSEYIKNNLDSAYCQMLTYYKNKEYILDPPEDYYVSLFYRINQYNNFYFKANVPVLVDPTRRMDSGNFKIFNRDEIQMHHLSYVRNDIKSKLDNSSANISFSNTDIVINHYNTWKPGDVALLIGNEIKKYNTKNVNYLK